MDKYDKLDKLKKLLDEKAITQEEFDEEKERLLHQYPAASGVECWGMQEKDFCMLLHLSQFLSFLFPFLGLIMPLIMWATEKDNSEEVDAHGRIVLNWVLSSLIYFIVLIIMSVLLIGIPFLIALIIADIVFVIMGAIKANRGERWSYPLSIPFFSVQEREM